MSNTMKRTARLAVTVLVGGGLLMVGPAAAHATSTTIGGIHPATTDQCPNGMIDLHHNSSNSDTCLPGTPRSENWYQCDVDWINTGSNWVAFTWGLNNYNNYQPGLAPWTTWAGGLPVCIGRIDVNT